MTSQRMILCLGPHRSGTSTVAAALGMLGAELALPDIYANAENTKGFFEQPEVLAFDEKLLAALDGAWDAPDFDCAAALAKCADAEALAAEAVQLIQRLFGGAAVAAMKDPRQCILVAVLGAGAATGGVRRSGVRSCAARSGRGGGQPADTGNSESRILRDWPQFG